MHRRRKFVEHNEKIISVPSYFETINFEKYFSNLQVKINNYIIL